MAQRASRFSIVVTADDAAVRTVSGVPAGSERSSAAASWLPREARVATAARRSVSGDSERASTMAARAASSARRAAPLLSRDRARVDDRQGGGVARLEHGLGGPDALLRIGGEEREGAEGAFDDAAQPVVEANRPQRLGVRLDRVAGLGVTQSTPAASR